MSELNSPGHLEHLQKVAQRKNNYKEKFNSIFHNMKSCTLEIGCGHGHYLTAYARAFNDEFCVGLDIIGKRVEKSNKKRSKEGLDNLIFLKTEATEFVECVPEELKFNKIFILFPDPWPKKRHFERRLIQSKFLDMIHKKASPGAKIFFRTDHNGYFDWTHSMITEHSKWTLIDEQWPFEEVTFFQSIMGDYQSLIAQAKN